MTTNWQTKQLGPSDEDVNTTNWISSFYYNNFFYMIGYGSIQNSNFCILTDDLADITHYLFFYITGLTAPEPNLFGKKSQFAQNQNFIVGTNPSVNSSVYYFDINNITNAWNTSAYDTTLSSPSSIVCLNFNGNAVFLLSSNDNNFYLSSDNGQSWTQIINVNYESGLTSTHFSDMTFFNYNSQLLCIDTFSNLSVLYGQLTGNLANPILSFFKTEINLPLNVSNSESFVACVNSQFNVFGRKNDASFYTLMSDSNYNYATVVKFAGEISGVTSGIAMQNFDTYTLFCNVQRNDSNGGIIQVTINPTEVSFVQDLNFLTFSITSNETDLIVATGALKEIAYTAFVPTPPICLLSDCDILLSDHTYKNITLLTTDDEIFGYFSGQPIKIQKIIKHVHFIDFLQETNKPYLIKKDAFGENVPNRDIHLSGHHRIILKENKEKYVGVQTFKLANCYKAKMTEDEVVYYHILLEDKNEGLIVNNLPVESCRDNI